MGYSRFFSLTRYRQPSGAISKLNHYIARVVMRCKACVLMRLRKYQPTKLFTLLPGDMEMSPHPLLAHFYKLPVTYHASKLGSSRPPSSNGIGRSTGPFPRLIQVTEGRRSHETFPFEQ